MTVTAASRIFGRDPAAKIALAGRQKRREKAVYGGGKGDGGRGRTAFNVEVGQL